MKTKEIKITPPEGFEIDKENSTLEYIKFKPIEKKRWRDDENNIITGYWINSSSEIRSCNDCYNIPRNHCVFATEKQVKSALAMAHISQIMANDERFGGVVTDKEWKDINRKYVLRRCNNRIILSSFVNSYYFLAFHTVEQRNLFLKENEDLVKDYLMIGQNIALFFQYLILLKLVMECLQNYSIACVNFEAEDDKTYCLAGH